MPSTTHDDLQVMAEHVTERFKPFKYWVSCPDDRAYIGPDLWNLTRADPDKGRQMTILRGPEKVIRAYLLGMLEGRSATLNRW